MVTLKRPILRFSQAVEASGLKPKTLRNWLDRESVTLFSDRDKGWQEFSYADIAMLALLAKMTDAGMPLASASACAHQVIAETGLVDGHSGDWPANALLFPFTNRLLLIWTHDGETRHQLIAESAFSKKPHSTLEAVFVLRPAFIILTAFQSLEDEFGDV